MVQNYDLCVICGEFIYARSELQTHCPACQKFELRHAAAHRAEKPSANFMPDSIYSIQVWWKHDLLFETTHFLERTPTGNFTRAFRLLHCKFPPRDSYTVAAFELRCGRSLPIDSETILYVKQEWSQIETPTVRFTDEAESGAREDSTNEDS